VSPKRAAPDTLANDYTRLASGIRSQLSSFPKSDVERFLRTVGKAVSAAQFHAEYSNEADRLSRLRAVHQSTLKFIASVEPGPPIARAFPRRIFDPPPPSDSDQLEHEQFYRAMQNARQAALDFRKELDRSLDIAARDRQNRTRRRPPADSFGMAAYIARRYLEIFRQRPTSTPGGPFSNIVVLALEQITGKAPRDVSRHVRAAIKDL
jgi:hypothetical protein